MIDAHLHLWDPSHLGYDWLRYVPDIAGRHGPDDWAAEATGITRAVFVQADCAPEQALAEADWVAGLKHPALDILAVVAFASLDQGAAVASHLDALAARPLVRGVRRSVQNEAAGFIAAPDHLDGLVLAAERGLTLDVCARDHQLPELHQALLALFERAPQARVVLDHLGKPDIATADGDLNHADWAANLKRLAALPNVFAKLSGLTAQDAWDARRDDVVRRYLDHALDCFAIDRLMFGGDWPVVNLAGGYGRWRDLFETAIAALPSLEREKIRTDTARAFYFGGADKDLSA
jgi:L-fuconolactonase